VDSTHRHREVIQNGPMETRPPDGNDGTQSIERAITVLRVLATRPHFGWGLTELAGAAGLNKATTHRILSRLERERLVHRRGAGDHYFLGPMLGELSLSIPGFHEFVAQSQEFITELARRNGVVTILSLRSGDHFVVVARVASSRLKGELNEVGARRPLISTAGGIALLVKLPDEMQERIVQANIAQLSLRGHTRTADYRAMWERSRRLGYGTKFGDIAPGINAISVAAEGAAGDYFASVTFAGPDSQLTMQRCADLVPALERETQTLTELASLVHPGLYASVNAESAVD
jgi:DNA-binding IclR family transcriptional regulator